MADVEALRYPIGRFQRVQTPLDPARRAAEISSIEQAPGILAQLTAGLSDAQLETPYRPGGWTIRQVIHHVPDSHINAYVRMKLAATEDEPVIRVYEEARWAELPEAKSAPIMISLELLAALHRRWVAFLRNLPEADFARAFIHPAWQRMTIDEAIAQYAWHGRHHAAHVRQALGVGV